MASRKADAGQDADGAAVVKKYANRRLYDTRASVYVTLADLAAMAREGKEFVVHDARTGEDITRSVLVQIILESENRGENLLPLDFLRGIAGVYGDALQWALPGYLESTMEIFRSNQEALRSQMGAALGGKPSEAGLEQLAKSNREMFERAMRMFAPFGGAREDSAASRGAAQGSGEEIADMRSQLAELRGRLDQIASDRDGL